MSDQSTLDNTTRLFLGNLNPEASEDDIMAFFAAAQPTEVKLVTHHNGTRKLYGFVSVTTGSEGAALALNGQPLMDWELKVEASQPIVPRPPKVEGGAKRRQRKGRKGRTGGSGAEGGAEDTATEGGESEGGERKQQQQKQRQSAQPRAPKEVRDYRLHSSVPLVDIGVNLIHRTLGGRNELLQRAALAGVTTIIATGTSYKSSVRSLAAARETYPADISVFCTVGVHPHDAVRCTEETLPQLEQLMEEGKDKVVAIGECGLDFDRNFSPPEDQIRVFTQQVAMAVRLQKPLFLHERKAHKELLAVLDAATGTLPPICIHCFTGTTEELAEYAKRGYYVGITGFLCMESRGAEVRAALAQVGFSQLKLMVETDAPFMSPIPRRSRTHDVRVTIGAEGNEAEQVFSSPRDACNFDRRNEPSSLPLVVEKLAEIFQVDIKVVGKATTDNAKAFFGV